MTEKKRDYKTRSVDSWTMTKLLLKKEARKNATLEKINKKKTLLGPTEHARTTCGGYDPRYT